MTTLHLEQEFVCARTFSLYELVEAFFQYHKLEHATDHGIKKAFQLLFEFDPHIDTGNISAEKLYDFQNSLTDHYARNYCNRIIGFIRRVFKWSTIKGMVTYQKCYELSLVTAIKKGDRRARENKPRKDAKHDDIEALIEHCRPIIGDMLRLQYMHGMRPSEVCNLQAGMIQKDYDGENWLCVPEEHKTAGVGVERTFVFGKESQAILNKYWPNDSEGHFFINKYKKPFISRAYGRAVKKAIDKYTLKKVTPYQLRHTAATAIDKAHSLEHARAVLGHTTTTMTRRYVHNNPDRDKIREVTKQRERVFSRQAAVPEEPGAITVPVLRIYRGE